MPVLALALAALGCGQTEAAGSAPGELTLLVADGSGAVNLRGSIRALSIESSGVTRRRFEAVPPAARLARTAGPARDAGGPPVELIRLELPPGHYTTLALELGEGPGPGARTLVLPIDPPLALGPGEERELAIDPGWATARAEVPLPSGPRPPRVWDPSSCGAVTGLVRRGTELVAGVDLRALPAGERDPEAAVALAITDADGSFALPSLPAGTYDLVASNGELRGEQLQLFVPAGSRHDLTLELR